MKKLVISCAVVLVTLLLVVPMAGCQQEPPPSEPPPSLPTIEGLTYTNSEQGFSVEFPEDWDVMEDYMGMVVAFMGPLVLEGAYYININVRVEQLPEKMTFEDFVKSGELADKRTIPNYKKIEEYSTTIAGLPANMHTITGTVKLDEKDLLLKDGVARFVKDEVGYVITYDTPEEFHDEYADCFELVISSFKFE